MADEAKTHSSLGASIAYRWFACPGSVALCEKAPAPKQSEYAAQGTLAHKLIEDRFKHPEKELDIPDQLDSDDVAAINFFLDFVEEERQKAKYIAQSEIQFSLDRIMPGLYGTCDYILMTSDLKKLVITDYKHGAGIPVEVVGNKQMLYYALGAIQEMDAKYVKGVLDVLGWGGVFEEVEIVIVQPRCRHKDGFVRRWVVPPAELEAFSVELKAKAEEAMKDNAPLCPGDHCRFCPAQAICPAIADKALAIAQADFADVKAGKVITLPSPQALTPDDLGKVLTFAPLLESWLKEVEGYALDCLQKGQSVQGFKLVKKRANRVWKNEAEAASALSLLVAEDVLWEKKFTTPAKIEKILKKDKKIVADLVTVPDNGNTIAPDHDPREAVKGTAETDFGKIHKGETLK